MLKQKLTLMTSAYKHQLKTQPLRTKMLTSAAVFSLGDYCCQQVESKIKSRQQKKSAILRDDSSSTEFSKKASRDQKTSITSLLTNETSRSATTAPTTTQDKHDWDQSRTVRQGIIGGLLLSPGLHFFLTRVMTKVNFAQLSRPANIGIRVSVHQACMMPFIQFTLLFASGMLQPANSIEERIAAGKKRFSEKWRAGFCASLMFWPFVNTVMYTLVQPRFFNLYADTASLVFSSIMSYITYKDCDTKANQIEVISSTDKANATAGV